MSIIDYENLILNEELFGLEIIDGTVRILKLNEKRGKFVVSGFAEEELENGTIEKGVVINPSSAAVSIKRALQNAKPNKIRDKYVNVVLPDDKVFIRVVKFPKEMTKEEIKESIEWKAKDLIAMPIDEVYWDWHRFKSSEESDKQEVVLSAVDRETVDSFTETLDMIGIVPLYYDISGNAAVRYLFREAHQKRKALLVRIDRNSSTLSIFFGGGVRYQTQINEGYGKLLEDIKQKFNIDEKEALRLVSDPDSVDKKLEEQFSQVLSENYNPLIKHIGKTLDYYFKTFEKNTEDNEREVIDIFTYGKGALSFQSKNIKEDNPFTIKPFKLSAEKSSSTLTILRRHDVSKNIVLFGLSLRNLGQFKKMRDINLIPDKLQQKYIQKSVYTSLLRYLRILLWSVLSLAVLLFLIYAYINVYKESVKGQLETVEKLAQSQSNIKFEKDIEYVNSSSSQLHTIYSMQKDWNKFFEETSNTLGDKILLDNLLVTDDSEAWEALSDDKVPAEKGIFYFVVNGIALNRQALMDYEQRLKESNMFNDIRMPISNFEQKTNIDFTMYCLVDQDQLKHEE